MPGQCRPITSTNSPALSAGSDGPIPHTISGSGSLTDDEEAMGELDAAARRLLRELLLTAGRVESRESVVGTRFFPTALDDAEDEADDEEEEEEEEDDNDADMAESSGKGGERVRPRLRPLLLEVVPPAVPAAAKGLCGFTNCVGSLTARDSARRWSDSFALIRASLVTGAYNKINYNLEVKRACFRLYRSINREWLKKAQVGNGHFYYRCFQLSESRFLVRWKREHILDFLVRVQNCTNIIVGTKGSFCNALLPHWRQDVS